MSKRNGTGLVAARAPVACPDCGRQISGNNLSRHRAAAHGTEAPTTKASTNGRARHAKAAAFAVGRYLALLDEESEQRQNGKRRGRGVNLGALKGFPAHTDDPDVIHKAADAIAAKALEVPSYVAALKLQQRVVDLRRRAEEIRTGDGPDAIEAAFVAEAAAWAEANGIGYAAFRAMGVPAAVLRDAGISS